MHSNFFSIFTGTGRYVPARVVKNEQFLDREFYDQNGEKINTPSIEIIDKFQQITEIDERRYVEDEYVTSDIGFFAAQQAIASARIDKEDLDYIIVAHNFGDVTKADQKSDLVPTIASRIKHNLGIANPYTIAYDLPFGCPGWLQAVIQADYYLRSGDAKKILVIGSETLSRVSDPYDRDSMLYSDGAGAVVMEAVENDEPLGIIAHTSRSDTLQHSHLLKMGRSNNPDYKNDNLFLKMEGRKLYEYALNTVPQVIKECMEKARITIDDIKKVLIHQANTKMDDAMLGRLFKLFGIREIPEYIMPMTISKYGNNSVATLPILLDLIMKGEFDDHRLLPGDYLVFASVGAGMNSNALVYKTV